MHQVDFVDVTSREDLPPLDIGLRYLDFIGGTKELRCYVVPQDLPRCIFMTRHAADLDSALEPIYQHDGIVVRQDASFPLPGFYVLSFTDQYRALDAIDEVTSLRAFRILREVRSAQRRVLEIDFVHMYYEEKPDPSCNVHYWLMPLRRGGRHEPKGIVLLDLAAYLGQWRYQEQRAAMLAANAAVRSHLAAVGLRERDERFAQ